MVAARAISEQGGATGRLMGDVVLFSQAGKPALARPRDDARATAQILFFTGVRYERMSDCAPTASRPPASDGGVRGKRKRKRG